MLAAATTLWLMFALWLAAPHIGVPAGIARTALGLLALALGMLLAWSYGCETGECTAVGTTAGVAARTDLPILAALFLVVVTARYVRRALPHRL